MTKTSVGTTSLAIRCPHCGIDDNHRCTKTYRRRYRWNDEATQVLQEQLGKDVSYRRRERWCLHCQKSFDVAEITTEYLGKLIKEVVARNKEAKDLRWLLNRRIKYLENAEKQLSSLEQELTDAKAKIRCIDRIMKRNFASASTHETKTGEVRHVA